MVHLTLGDASKERESGYICSFVGGSDFFVGEKNGVGARAADERHRGTVRNHSEMDEQLLEVLRIASRREITDKESQVLISELSLMRNYSNALVLLPAALWAVLPRENNYASNYALMDAFDKALASCGVSRPSQLFAQADRHNRTVLVTFMRDAARLEVLICSVEYTSREDLASERLKILDALCTLDSGRITEYQAERRTIIIERTQKALAGAPDRVGVNVQVLRAMIVPQLRELVDQGIDKQDGNSRAFKTGLKAVIRAAQQDLVYGKGGLETHISMRIRHGTLSAVILGFLEEAGIPIEPRRSDSRPHSVSSHPIESELAVFSQEIHSLLTWINEFACASTENNRDCLINLAPSNQEVDLLCNAAPIDATAEELATFILDELWSMVLKSLAVGRLKVLEELRHSIDSTLTRLAERLSESTPIMAQPVLSAIDQCRQSTQVLIGKIENWFTPTNGVRLPPFTMAEALETALALLLYCERQIAERPTIEVDSTVLIQGHRFDEFVDIWFLLLDNVERHSPRGLVDASVSAKIDSYSIQLKISNPVRPNAVNQLPKLDLDAAVTDDLTSRAQREGGSGWSKLLLILQTNLHQSSPELEVQVSEDHIFTFRIRIDAANHNIFACDGMG